MKRILFLGLFLIFTASFASAAEIVTVKYINLMYPWVLTINSDGTTEWNDGSGGYTFTEAKETKTGKITEDQWNELLALLATQGYTEEKPFEGVEPKLRVGVILSDGESFVNCAPTVMDDAAVEGFIPIEEFFINLAKHLGAPEFETELFYKK